jgi:hypothetical protein
MAAFAHHNHILLVEPDSTWRALLAARLPASVDAHDRFETARDCLELVRYDLIVTNLRLGAHNGLHLVYVARLSRAATQAIVYDEESDLGLARAVQQAGAMYEFRHRLVITLPTYVGANLPARDRRTPLDSDRRVVLRGGRRRWDRHVLAVSPSPSG